MPDQTPPSKNDIDRTNDSQALAQMRSSLRGSKTAPEIARLSTLPRESPAGGREAHTLLKFWIESKAMYLYR